MYEMVIAENYIFVGREKGHTFIQCIEMAEQFFLFIGKVVFCSKQIIIYIKDL